MKKDRSTKMEDKYWEGISSLQEEKILKTNADEPYFNGLNELSEEKMDLEFDTFMEMAEGSDGIVDDTKKKSKLLYVTYAAAAIALFVAGLFFLRNMPHQEAKYQQPQFSDVSIVPKAVDVQESKVGQEQPSYAEVSKKENKQNKHKNSGPRSETVSLLEQEPTEESYVILNGQPVYDQEEAEQIVLASLKIMASNFQEGKHALEKVKYINVEL
ncbi:hypothetical protein [Sphingobacterium paludis]|nr:hypothetical protein [Sphingobacterium paludis]